MPYADGSLPVERLVPCIQCVAVQDQHFFTIEQCIAQSYQSDSIWCPSHEGEVELKALTPDVMFADIDGKFFINEGDLDIEQMKESDLGVGSFGSVYQVKMEGKKTVAVKVFAYLFFSILPRNEGINAMTLFAQSVMINFSLQAKHYDFPITRVDRKCQSFFVDFYQN